MLERLASSPPSHLRTRDWMQKLASHFVHRPARRLDLAGIRHVHGASFWTVLGNSGADCRVCISHTWSSFAAQLLVAFSSGLILWSLHPTVAIQLPASVHLHMHRLGTLLGLILSYRAGCASRTRVCLCGTAAGGFCPVEIRDLDGEWRPFWFRPPFLTTCIVAVRSWVGWELNGRILFARA